MSVAAEEGRFERVAVVAKRTSDEAIETARELVEWLRRRGLEVTTDAATSRSIDPAAEGDSFDPSQPCDLVVVLGGDGTLLSVARTIRHEVPILGVNLGRLGFLTEIGRSELYPVLVAVLSGRYRTEERFLLEVELRRASGEVLSFRVLNDAVIAKSALARIVELRLEVDGHLVTRIRSDGLIISTPTGSTAYNLSAGGPIAHPTLPIVLLTPICPHALGLRPIVVPHDALVEVTLETPDEEVFLTLDGQQGEEVVAGDRVAVRYGGSRIRLVRASRRTFYDSLRSKLRWGE